MKVILALLAICMIAPCLAEQQTVTVGPYAVTFDWGVPIESYMVSTWPQEFTPFYYVELINDTNPMKRVTIKLTEYHEDQLKSTPSELITFSEVALRESGSQFKGDIVTATRKIDGANGGMASGIASGSQGQKYTSGYSEYSTEMWAVTYEPTVRLSVNLVSSYPWDEGTLQLLKTIHVTKTA
jgi:hypothetical protein